MQINCDKIDGITQIALSGRLDSVTAGTTFDHLCSHLEPVQARVVLDGTALEYVSSAGLRTLLGVAKKVRASGGRIVIFGMSAAILEILEISGFHSVIPTYPDRDAAQAAVRV